MVGRLRSLLAEPLLHFVLVGFVLFALNQRYAPQESPITLSEDGLAVLVADFRQLRGRAPTASERQQLIDEYYRGEVLFREALRRRLAQRDPALREALIERMQSTISGELSPPAPEQLVDFYAANIERYYREPSITLRQHFSRQSIDAPEQFLRRLQVGTAPPGDRAPQGDSFPDYGHSMLRGLFGQAVLDALVAAPLDEWIGPFQTRDGWHFFRVTGRREKQLLSFASAREQVAADYRWQQIAERLDVFVSENSSRYPLQQPASAPL